MAAASAGSPAGAATGAQLVGNVPQPINEGIGHELSFVQHQHATVLPTCGHVVRQRVIGTRLAGARMHRSADRRGNPEKARKQFVVGSGHRHVVGFYVGARQRCHGGARCCRLSDAARPGNQAHLPRLSADFHVLGDRHRAADRPDIDGNACIAAAGRGSMVRRVGHWGSFP